MVIGKSICNVPALTYLLETEILSIVEYQLKCCSVTRQLNAAPDCCMPSHGLVWSSVLSTRPSTTGMDGCMPVRELMDNTSNICSEPQTSSFGLILLFNFANMHFVIGTLSNCCLLHKVQLQHVKPGLVGWMTLAYIFVTKFFWHVSAKNYEIRMASGKLIAHSKRATV